jgi:ATP-dependent DNA ligase
MQEIFASDPELRSIIIDSEIVAIDPVDGSLKTFQELSNRARKDVQIHDVKVAVGVYAFDLMYLDGEVSSVLWHQTDIRCHAENLYPAVDIARAAIP